MICTPGPGRSELQKKIFSTRFLKGLVEAERTLNRCQNCKKCHYLFHVVVMVPARFVDLPFSRLAILSTYRFVNSTKMNYFDR